MRKIQFNSIQFNSIQCNSIQCIKRAILFCLLATFLVSCNARIDIKTFIESEYSKGFISATYSPQPNIGKDYYSKQETQFFSTGTEITCNLEIKNTYDIPLTCMVKLKNPSDKSLFTKLPTVTTTKDVTRNASFTFTLDNSAEICDDGVYKETFLDVTFIRSGSKKIFAKTVLPLKINNPPPAAALEFDSTTDTITCKNFYNYSDHMNAKIKFIADGIEYNAKIFANFSDVNSYLFRLVNDQEDAQKIAQAKTRSIVFTTIDKGGLTTETKIPYVKTYSSDTNCKVIGYYFKTRENLSGATSWEGVPMNPYSSSEITINLPWWSNMTSIFGQYNNVDIKFDISNSGRIYSTTSLSSNSTTHYIDDGLKINLIFASEDFTVITHSNIRITLKIDNNTTDKIIGIRGYSENGSEARDTYINTEDVNEYNPYTFYVANNTVRVRLQTYDSNAHIKAYTGENQIQGRTNPIYIEVPENITEIPVEIKQNNVVKKTFTIKVIKQ